MKKNADSKIKKIYVLSFVIIVITSMEVMMKAKSIESFNLYKAMDTNMKYTDFINYILIEYFFNIIEPVIISVYTLVSYKKLGITSLYKIVFSTLIFAKIINIILRFEVYSFFYYVCIGLYVIFFVVILRLKKGGGKDELF